MIIATSSSIRPKPSSFVRASIVLVSAEATIDSMPYGVDTRTSLYCLPSLVFLSVTGRPSCSVSVRPPVAYEPPTMPISAELRCQDTSRKTGAPVGNVPSARALETRPLTEIATVGAGVGVVVVGVVATGGVRGVVEVGVLVPGVVGVVGVGVPGTSAPGLLAVLGAAGAPGSVGVADT